MGGWLVVWESTDPIWGSVDAGALSFPLHCLIFASDLVFSSFPHPDFTAFCGSAIPAAVFPPSGTKFTSLASLRLASSPPLPVPTDAISPTPTLTVVISVWVAANTLTSVDPAPFAPIRVQYSVSVDGSAKVWSVPAPILSSVSVSAVLANSNVSTDAAALPSVPHLTYVGNGSFIAAWQAGTGANARVVMARRPPGIVSSPDSVCSNGGSPVVVNGAAGTVSHRNYSFGDRCQWLIGVPGSASIEIRFRGEFLTRGTADSLTLYNGPTTSSPVLAILSSNISNPARVTASQPFVLLSFSANVTWTVNNTLSEQRSGFSVAYSVTFPAPDSDLLHQTWSHPYFIPSPSSAPQISPCILWEGGVSSKVWAFYSTGAPTATIYYTTSAGTFLSDAKHTLFVVSFHFHTDFGLPNILTPRHRPRCELGRIEHVPFHDQPQRSNGQVHRRRSFFVWRHRRSLGGLLRHSGRNRNGIFCNSPPLLIFYVT